MIKREAWLKKMTPPIPLDEALALVLSEADTRMEAESAPLAEALGRRLAGDLRIDVPWPVTDRSAMDGFALAAGKDQVSPGQTFLICGESLAGQPFPRTLKPGEAIRIMTGAVVPEGADVVVPVEQTSGFEGQQVTIQAEVRPGAHIRRAGSELARDSLVLAASVLIRPAEIGALAVLGVDPVPVFRRPMVAILSTGDEVVDVRRVPAPHQVRDSNSHAVAAQVRTAGALPLHLGIAADEQATLQTHLSDGFQRADVVLTIGGVSKGTHDLVDSTLVGLGVRKVFHGIRLKPGMPTFFGVLESAGRKQFVFGLPGNPASCFTVFDLLVRPLLEQIGGAPSPGERPVVALAGVPFPTNARLQALRARLVVTDGGSLQAELAAPRPSGDPFSLLHGDGYALIPPQSHPLDTTKAIFVPGADRRS